MPYRPTGKCDARLCLAASQASSNRCLAASGREVIKETGAIPCFEYVQGVNTYSHRCRRSDSLYPAHW